MCVRAFEFFCFVSDDNKKGKETRSSLFFLVLFRNGGESLQDDVDGHQVTAVRTDQVWTFGDNKNNNIDSLETERFDPKKEKKQAAPTLGHQKARR